MTEPKNLSDTLRDALAKKHAAAHPDAKSKKGKKSKTKKSSTPAVAGRPVQRAQGRGGWATIKQSLLIVAAATKTI